MPEAPPIPPARPRAAALHAWAIVWLVNSLGGALLGTLYIGESLDDASLGVCAWVGAALVSSLATVLLVVDIPLLPLVLLAPRARATGIVVAVWSTLALALVYADTSVYGLFRYHFNGMVLNLLMTPGGTDNFQIPPITWAIVGAGIAVTLGFELWLWRFLMARPQLRVVRYALPALLLVVAGEKFIYAFADAYRARSITGRAALFPLYQRFTMRSTLARWITIDTSPEASVEVAKEGSLLHYPHTMPKVSPTGARPNILIVTIDSLRADAFTPELMPRVTKWARGARVYRDHLAGGNATRFGVFSIIYGLHGSYWMPIYEQRRSPVLVDVLTEAGYELRVLSATKMTFPEFRSTAWVTMQDRVFDTFEQPEKYARDAAVAEHFENWLAERQQRRAQEPFFCFMLLDSPHQTYSWPPEETFYEPSLRHINYVALARRPGPKVIDALRNSYWNSVRYADRITGQMLDSLAAHGELDNTLVIVTGDHGEEFFENGFYGHTSNFTPEQAQVAFLLGGPGVPPGVETRPTTHVDVPPTLLELMGADPAQRAAWCQGENLLAPPAARDRVVAGWQEVALWVDGGILHVPLEGHKGLVQARQRNWKPIDPERPFLDRHGAAMMKLAIELRRFLK